MVQIFAGAKCFDSRAAERYFKERRIPFQRIDLARYGMSRKELESVWRAVGGRDKLLNERHPDAALVRHLAYETDQMEKLLDDPGLIKTPVVRCGRLATVGFCPEVWKGWPADLLGKK